MKNVVIIGGNGSLAKCVIKELHAKADLHLTLFLRNKRKLSGIELSGMDIVEGNVMGYNVLKDAIKGKDIIYVNLAGDLGVMGKNIVKAMQEENVKRIIAISSIGIYEIPLRPVLLPHKELADVIEASDLDYTILRPEWFTDANEVDYELTRKGEPEKGAAISRKSIAAFVVEITEAPEKHNRKNLGIA